jgi:hypothetical protein
MEKQFVTYEIAVKLKELGFDERCFGAFLRGKYYPFDITHRFFGEPQHDIVLAPLWQQAIDWCRSNCVYFIEDPMREQNPAYFVYTPGRLNKEGPYRLPYAMKRAMNIIEFP